MAATAVPVGPPRRRHRRLGPRVGDDRLVARVRAGDHDAFEAIYDRYYLGLLAFCRHMLGSRDEAEDALQQSFASAYRALRAGTGVVDLRPWLYAIARNRCLSALRSQRDELSFDSFDFDVRPFDGLPAEIQQRAELRELVEDLQRLPEDQRAALVLFELGDQCHGQIADVLGVRREKVKALVFQAREALLRARRAREAPCADIRGQLATATGDVPRRGLVRTHIDRCPGCAAFEREVRHQRAAFAAILPVAPTVGLKGSVLALLGGGGAAAAGGVSATTVAGSVAAGGTTVGLASLGAKGVVTKVLAVVAIAGGASESHVTKERPVTRRAPAVHHVAAQHQAVVGAPMPATPARRAAPVIESQPTPTASRHHREQAPAKLPPASEPTAPIVPPVSQPTAAPTPAASAPAAAPAPDHPASPAAPTSPAHENAAPATSASTDATTPEPAAAASGTTSASQAPAPAGAAQPAPAPAVAPEPTTSPAPAPVTTDPPPAIAPDPSPTPVADSDSGAAQAAAATT
jgi:RNA polymerase sigma factor (sigma-70 family)